MLMMEGKSVCSSNDYGDKEHRCFTSLLAFINTHLGHGLIWPNDCKQNEMPHVTLFTIQPSCILCVSLRPGTKAKEFRRCCRVYSLSVVPLSLSPPPLWLVDKDFAFLTYSPPFVRQFLVCTVRRCHCSLVYLIHLVRWSHKLIRLASGIAVVGLLSDTRFSSCLYVITYAKWTDRQNIRTSRLKCNMRDWVPC